MKKVLAKRGNLLYIALENVNLKIHGVSAFMKVVSAYVLPALPRQSNREE